MAPSRKRASTLTHNRAIAAPKRQKPNQSSISSNSMVADDEKCNESESSAPINDSEILQEQISGPTKCLTIKDEPKEVNINLAELVKHCDTQTGQVQPLEATKDEESVQEYGEPQNVPQNVPQEPEGKKSTCFCGKSYSCNSHLNRHQKKTHGSIIRLTTSSETASTRENVKEKNEERRFSCHCGKSYTNASNLKRHNKICTPDASGDNKVDFAMPQIEDKEAELIKPYICICGKSYTCSSHLYRHQKSHQEVQGSPERRYVCECGKSYSCSSHLNRHQKSHMKEPVIKVEQNNIKAEEPENPEEKMNKPYQCFCGKSYTCSSHLYRHQKIHPELNVAIRERCTIRDSPSEKRFECQCGKSYSCRSHLNRHQKSHQEKAFIAQNNDCDGGEANFEEPRQKPFICECGKKFILSFSLLLHKKIHCRWKPTNSDSDPPGH